MSTGYKIEEQGEAHFLTFQIIKWIDLFTRQVYRDIVIDSLSFCQSKKEMDVFAYVIMSNHIHLIARSNNGRLSDTIRDFKSYTAKLILKAIEDEEESRRDWMMNLFGFSARQHKRSEIHQVWTHENHAEILYSNKFIDQKIRYIHNNPVRAGIIEHPEDYLYSSARNYAGLSNLMDVIVVPLDSKKPFLRRTVW